LLTEIQPGHRAGFFASGGFVNSQFYKTNELAKFLNVSRWTVNRMVESGDLPKPIRVGSRYRWFIAEIESWLQQRAMERGEVQG
jgi:excisionase family DNA binding protein